MTHVVFGAATGLVAVVIAGMDTRLSPRWSAALIAAGAAAGGAPDLDAFIGRHPETFHNVFALWILPASILVVAAQRQWWPDTRIAAATVLLPVASIGHGWADLWDSVGHRGPAMWWPFGGELRSTGGAWTWHEYPIADAETLIGAAWLACAIAAIAACVWVREEGRLPLPVAIGYVATGPFILAVISLGGLFGTP